jgi:hypothetical protein
MNDTKHAQILNLTKTDIEELVAAYCVPEFCWPINDLYTLQYSSLGLNFCSKCYQIELNELVCPVQRSRFINHTNKYEDVSRCVYGNQIIELRF